MGSLKGFFSLVLHAHLPFVRHPEHDRALEETWLFEAITETYVPLLRILERWESEGIKAPLTLTLTPTFCSMLQDPCCSDDTQNTSTSCLSWPKRKPTAPSGKKLITSSRAFTATG